MEELKEYTIPFIGLKNGEHHFDFQIEQAFFDHFEYDDFSNADIRLDVRLLKKPTLLEFNLDFNGRVNFLCDLTNEPYDQQIEGSHHFVVKFGTDYNDEDDEILIIPHGSHQVNIQQQVYETIVLSLPVKRIHPGVVDGSLKSDVLDRLESLSLGSNETNDNEEEQTDPRWDDLKKLLTDKDKT